MTNRTIEDFIIESNAIEGINRPPTEAEIAEAKRFLSLNEIKLQDLMDFVSIYQPNAELRAKKGLNVIIGGHWPPFGGIAIKYRLIDLLERAQGISANSHKIHVEYELLHPFTDGNGRSGRILWLWMEINNRGKVPQLSFLHSFYYSTLNEARL